MGSLDNVYNEETAAAMMKEDPFKTRAPVMDKESATPAEMEKTVDALIVYESEGGSTDCSSPRESCSSPDGSLSPVSPTPEKGLDLDLLTARSEGSSGNNQQLPVGSSVEHLPDIVDVSSSSPIIPLMPTTVHASQVSNVLVSPPDIAAQSHDLPPDLRAESHTPLDLLNPEGGGDALLVDLTEGTPSDGHKHQ